MPHRPSLRVLSLAALSFAAVSLAAACTSHPLVSIDPDPEIQTDLPFSVTPETKLDVVFLIDNSRSMKQEQESLARNFPLFMQELQKKGPVDLRLAIISSDVGAGGIKVDSCQGAGHEGIFRAKPGCGLHPGATFIQLGKDGSKNFDGELPAVFGCLATLGIDGCGFEHQLQSLRVALYRPDQQNFLRPDAHLGIVLITDEDDCSGEPGATLYSEARPGEEANLRCATAGHLCQGQPVPAAPFSAPLASCQAFEHAGDPPSKLQRLINVSEVVSNIKALKSGRGRKITVAAIMGWDSGAGATHRVVNGARGLEVQPICEAGGDGPWAMPGVRLKAFIDAFGADGSWHSMCAPDLAPAIARIGETIVDAPDGVCLPPLSRDTDGARAGLQPECSVSARLADGKERLIPACGQGVTPCWELGDDGECRGRFLRISDPGMVASGGLAKASCSTCVSADDANCATSP